MEKKQKTAYKWIALLIIAIALFMVNLDMSIVNIAISKMMLTFNVTLDQIQWVISAYTLTLGITMPVSAYLTDRFGIKKIFIIALSLFTLGSFLCGISWNIASIIISRIIQGLGGGIIIPVSMAFLMNTFEETERGSAIAIIGITSMVAPALGPTLGGYIVQNFDWRLVFLINIPIGLVGIIAALKLLRETAHKPSMHFDLLGFLSAAIGMGCILYVLGKGNVDWGDLKNVMLMIVGGYSLIIFIVNELMIPEPMLNLRLFKNYTFCMSNIILNIGILALFGGVFLVPIFLQQLKGLTPFQTGIVLFPEAIATAVSMIIASKLSKKVGVRTFAVLALLLLAFNSYSMSRITLDTSNATITLLLMLRGLGVGFLIVPVQFAGFNAVLKEELTNASALLSTVKQIGTSVGVTVITSVMQHRNILNYAHLSDQVNAFNPNSMDLFKMLQGILMQGGASQTDAQGGAISLLYGMIQKQSLLQSLNDTMLVISILTIIIILPTLLLKEKKQIEGEVLPVMME